MSINIYCCSCCWWWWRWPLWVEHYMERFFDYWFVISTIVIWFSLLGKWVLLGYAIVDARAWELRLRDSEREREPGDFSPNSQPHTFSFRLRTIRFIWLSLYILSLRDWRVGVKTFCYCFIFKQRRSKQARMQNIYVVSVVRYNIPEIACVKIIYVWFSLFEGKTSAAKNTHTTHTKWK